MKIALSLATLAIVIAPATTAWAAEERPQAVKPAQSINFKAEKGTSSFQAKLAEEGILPTINGGKNGEFHATLILVQTEAINVISIDEEGDLESTLDTKGYRLDLLRSDKGKRLTDRAIKDGERIYLYEASYEGTTKRIALSKPTVEVKTDFLPVGMRRTIVKGSDGTALETTVTTGDPINPKKQVTTTSTAVVQAPRPRMIEVGAATPETRVPCKNETTILPQATNYINLIHQASCHLFPEIKVYGSFRPGANEQDHATGNATDIMNYEDAEIGQEIADYFMKNAKIFNIKYIIWSQEIWSVERADEGWRPMEDRGSITANHFDHVHISVNASTDSLTFASPSPQG